MISVSNCSVATPASEGSLVDGVLSIKGPYGRSVLQLELSGDSNSAHLELQVGSRLYTLDIRPKPRGAVIMKEAQQRAMEQRSSLSSAKNLSADDQLSWSKTSSLPGDSMS